MKITASGPITSWQIDRETMERVRDFIFLGSKITVDGDCHEITRHLLLGRKAMMKLDSILKSRDITLLTKVHLVKAMVLPVFMWELADKENWAAKNWWFWTVVLEKTLESPLDCKEIQWVLNIHWKDWCWSANTLATWCEELTHWKRHWCWERLKAGGEEEDRGWDGWMASPTQWYEFGQALGVGDGHGSLACCSPWGLKVLDMTEWLYWTAYHSILLKKLIYKRPSSSKVLDYTLERFSYYIKCHPG